MSDPIREALEGMVWQFAARFAKDGRRYLGTSGLSALEDAFEALGWPDPRPCDGTDLGCSEPGCAEWSTAGRPTVDGYKWFCGEHWRALERYIRAHD